MNPIVAQESAQYASTYSREVEAAREYFTKMYGKHAKWDESVDAYVIGKYSETVQSYAPEIGRMMEASGTSSANLGDMLKTSLGLVWSQYATSIIPFLGSTQPAEQEIALIYYKQALATTARGNLAVGDLVMNEFGKVNPDLDSYTGSTVVTDIKLTTTTANGTEKIKLINDPNRNSGIRVGSIAGSVKLTDNTVSFIDQPKNDGSNEGYLFGNKIEDGSTINYVTGEMTLKVTGGNDQSVLTVTFEELLAGGDIIPSFKYNLRSEAIAINYWPIQTTYDEIANFIARRKFGKQLDELAYQDLLAMINNTVSYNAIRQLRAAAIRNEATKPFGSNTALGTIEWSLVPQTGVSLVEHRRTFTDIYEIAHRRMEQLAGVGGVSAVIVGSEGRKIYRALGMADIDKGKAGAYVIGFWEGNPIIYAPQEVLPADEVLLIYKGDDWFSVPLVYAPFLPVMSVNVQGRLQNVFQKQVGTVHGAGLKVVNGGFVQRVVLKNS